MYPLRINCGGREAQLQRQQRQEARFWTIDAHPSPPPNVAAGYSGMAEILASNGSGKDIDFEVSLMDWPLEHLYLTGHLLSNGTKSRRMKRNPSAARRD